jgi:hypothetical protein
VTEETAMTETPPPARPKREKRTTPIHALVRESTGHAFRLWADKRGLTVSGAVEGLMVDALLREVTASPLGPLTRDLPPETLKRIVAVLRAPDTPATA